MDSLYMIIGISVATGLIFLLVGFYLGKARNVAILRRITQKFHKEIAALERERVSLNQHIHTVAQAQQNNKNAFLSLQAETVRLREFINKVRSDNANLAATYAKLQKEYTQIIYEKSTMSNAISSYEQMVETLRSHIAKMQTEITKSEEQSGGLRRENMALLKANSTLTQDHEQVVAKLKSVYVAYKRLRAHYDDAQKKIGEITILKADKEKALQLYAEAIEACKRYKTDMDADEILRKKNSSHPLDEDILHTPAEQASQFSPHN